MVRSVFVSAVLVKVLKSHTSLVVLEILTCDLFVGQ